MASSNGKRVIRILWLLFNVAIALGLLLSGYAGMLSPERCRVAGIAAMTFPAWLIAVWVVAIVDVFTVRRWTLLPLAAIILAAGPSWTYCPLNLGSPTPSDDPGVKTVKVLTYNICQYADYDMLYPADGTNRTLSYILSTDADIVSMQECDYISVFAPTHVGQEQVDSVTARYPYRIVDGRSGLSVWSKYPVEEHPLEHTHTARRCMAHFVVDMGDRKLHLVNAHLQSLGLTVEDKELYEELTELRADNNIRRAKSQLLHKITDASALRAKQARELRKYLLTLGDSERVVVCGDFNDIPGCYAIRVLTDGLLRDAFVDFGFGPCITFRANRMYFRIDHVLYGSALRPLSIVRGGGGSDHYPLLTVFELR